MTMKYPPMYKCQLTDVYKKRGVGTDKLRYCCDKATSCWQTKTHDKLRVRRNEGFITYPYIGERYHTNGLVVIATNHRDIHGKLTGPLKDHRSICKEINGLDDGFYFYKNLARYVIVLLSNKIFNSDGTETKKYWDASKKALQKIALVQAVKCNPCRRKKDQNQPTSQMWNNCPKYILSDELRVLKPGIILILGITNHDKKLDSLKALGYDQEPQMDKKHSVRYYSFVKKSSKRLLGRHIDVYVANHPSHAGRSIDKICEDLLALRNNRPVPEL